MSWKKLRDKINCLLYFIYLFIFFFFVQWGPNDNNRTARLLKKKKESSATEVLHTKWPAKIYNSKQWYLNVQNKLVAWKSLTIAANYKYFSTSQKSRKQIVIPRQFFSVYSHFQNSAPEQIKWPQHLFLWIRLFRFCLRRNTVKKQRKLSKFSPCQTDSQLKILNSPSVTNVTSGFMNVLDWLANQLTSKQDRTLAMIGQ